MKTTLGAAVENKAKTNVLQWTYEIFHDDLKEQGMNRWMTLNFLVNTNLKSLKEARFHWAQEDKEESISPKIPVTSWNIPWYS